MYKLFTYLSLPIWAIGNWLAVFIIFALFSVHLSIEWNHVVLSIPAVILILLYIILLNLIEKMFRGFENFHSFHINLFRLIGIVAAILGFRSFLLIVLGSTDLQFVWEQLILRNFSIQPLQSSIVLLSYFCILFFYSLILLMLPMDTIFNIIKLRLKKFKIQY